MHCPEIQNAERVLVLLQQRCVQLAVLDVPLLVEHFDLLAPFGLLHSGILEIGRDSEAHGLLDSVEKSRLPAAEVSLIGIALYPDALRQARHVD